MFILKTLFCSLTAALSLAVFLFLKNKSYELTAYKRLVVGGIALKLVGTTVIYIFYPTLSESSDAILYYFPEACKVLSGQLPNKDFDSSYSILFHTLLLPGLSVWRSVGSVVLTMILLETLMLFVYLRRCDRQECALDGWRVAFLYSFSPISIYWAAITGYNGVIISLFIILSLVLAEQRRNTLSAIFAAAGFSFSKLLMVLAYPAIVFFDRKHWIKRGVILTVLFGASVGVPLALGFDVLGPLSKEAGATTSGNVWFLLSPFVPEQIQDSPLWDYGAILLFGALFVPLLILFVNRRSEGFDSSMAFVAATHLLFMIVSRKAYTFYMLMALIFVLHVTVVSGSKFRVRSLLAIGFLGATTTIESYIWIYFIRDHSVTYWSAPFVLLWIIDFITVGCYLCLATLCLKKAAGEQRAVTWRLEPSLDSRTKR